MPLDISQLKLDAQLRLQFAEKAEELQRLAERLYPGSKVLISDGENSSKPAVAISTLAVDSDFKKLPFQQQIIRVLKDAGKAISKNDIFEELQKRGSEIATATLASYLSRGKDVFARVEPGLWRLK